MADFSGGFGGGNSGVNWTSTQAERESGSTSHMGMNNALGQGISKWNDNVNAVRNSYKAGPSITNVNPTEGITASSFAASDWTGNNIVSPMFDFSQFAEDEDDRRKATGGWTSEDVSSGLEEMAKQNAKAGNQYAEGTIGDRLKSFYYETIEPAANKVSEKFHEIIGPSNKTSVSDDTMFTNEDGSLSYTKKEFDDFMKEKGIGTRDNLGKPYDEKEFAEWLAERRGEKRDDIVDMYDKSGVIEKKEDKPKATISKMSPEEAAKRRAALLGESAKTETKSDEAAKADPRNSGVDPVTETLSEKLGIEIDKEAALPDNEKSEGFFTTRMDEYKRISSEFGDRWAEASGLGDKVKAIIDAGQQFKEATLDGKANSDNKGNFRDTLRDLLMTAFAVVNPATIPAVVAMQFFRMLRGQGVPFTEQELFDMVYGTQPYEKPSKSTGANMTREELDYGTGYSKKDSGQATYNKGLTAVSDEDCKKYIRTMVRGQPHVRNLAKKLTREELERQSKDIGGNTKTLSEREARKL